MYFAFLKFKKFCIFTFWIFKIFQDPYYNSTFKCDGLILFKNSFFVIVITIIVIIIDIVNVIVIIIIIFAVINIIIGNHLNGESIYSTRNIWKFSQNCTSL